MTDHDDNTGQEWIDPRRATLITDPARRDAQREKNRRAVLEFLRDETWSTAEILRELTGLKTRQGVHALLTKMERDELVKSAKLTIVGRTTATLWGITAHGIGMAMDPSQPYEDRPPFDPARQALSRIPHQIALQAVRLQAEAAGWTGWQRGERLGFTVPVRPDAIATTPDGVLVAIEVERTIKSAKRYRAILADHLEAIYARQWQGVVYLCDRSITQRVQRIYESLDYFIQKGERRPVTDQHRARWKFYDLTNEEWMKCKFG